MLSDSYHIECMKSSKKWNRPCIWECVFWNGHQEWASASALKSPLENDKTPEFIDRVTISTEPAQSVCDNIISAKAIRTHNTVFLQRRPLKWNKKGF